MRTYANDHPNTLTTTYGGSCKSNIFCFVELFYFFDRFRIFTDCFGFSAQYGFIYFKSLNFHEANICRNNISWSYNNDVSWNEITFFNAFFYSIAPYNGIRFQKYFESLYDIFRFVLLIKAKACIDHNKEYNHEAVNFFSKKIGKNCCSKKKIHKRRHKLPQEYMPARYFLIF